MGRLIAIASGSECGISWDECRRSIGVGRHWKMLHVEVTWEGWDGICKIQSTRVRPPVIQLVPSTAANH
jgi:hypothetical protein